MRNIPVVTKNLLIINVLMFLALFVFRRFGIDLNDVLGLHFFLASDFHIYQFVTYMFMHGGLSHIFFNMFALWMFGRIVESAWGARRFLIYYMVCGIGAGLMQEIVQFATYYFQDMSSYSSVMTQVGVMSMGSYLNSWTTVGASGAIYGILLAFGLLYPEERIFIFPLPVPIKAKWFVIIYAALELFLGFGTSGDGVAHFAHLGGMLFGYLVMRYWRRQANNYYAGAYYGNGYRKGKGFAERMKGWFSKLSFGKNGRNTVNDGRARETDWDYNARMKKEQEEIDRILDKIRKSGYDSLTDKEKRDLFEKGKN